MGVFGLQKIHKNKYVYSLKSHSWGEVDGNTMATFKLVIYIHVTRREFVGNTIDTRLEVNL